MPPNLIVSTGKDGTAAFEDVGHSSDAREAMKQYQIGILDNVRDLHMSLVFYLKASCSFFIEMKYLQ